MWSKMETPTVMYDLDTSGGLMEKIQTLLAPPKSEEGEKQSRKSDRRRSGRVSNHETCDSCREGGDLLFCDHCPAAFHLQCCNPPLSREKLPPGDWMCHRCTVHKRKREQKKEQINGLIERQLGKRIASPIPDQECRTLRPDPSFRTGGTTPQVPHPSSRPVTPTSNTSSDTLTASEQNNLGEDLPRVDLGVQGSGPEHRKASITLKRPFDLLIAAAMQRNPTQFQLPDDLTCMTSLPGTNKRRRRDELISKAQHKRDGDGLVPLPSKLCFTCTRSCRLAPLIQCDYCPRLYHMDCLDPPLAGFPTGRWMCPNHIRNEALNPQTSTFSNRCQLFDQFQDSLSQHAIKLGFLQQIHQQHIRQDRSRNPMKIPNAIKSQYQNPSTLLAPAGVREGELIFTGYPEASVSQYLTSEEEQRQWLKDVISLQCSIMRHLWKKQTSWLSEHTEKTDLKLIRDCCQKSLCTEGQCQKCKTTNGPVDQMPQSNGKTQETSLQKSIRTDDPWLKSLCSSTDPPLPVYVKSEQRTPECNNEKPLLASSAALILSDSTERTEAPAVKPQRIISDAESNGKMSPSISLDGKSSSDVFSCTELSGRIKDLMKSSGEVGLDSLDKKCIKLLAWQRIQQLFETRSTSVQNLPSVLASSRKLSEDTSKEVQARASLCSVSGKALNMCYRSFNIGTGADMDMCLTNYGHCNYVSGKHACIFYDEHTKQYELLNYSEHGTTVDDVLYSCDFSEKMNPTPSSNLVTKVQNIIRRCKKREVEKEKSATDEMLIDQPQEAPLNPCNCKTSSSTMIGGSGAGWEGTALLHHGSHVKLGCLEFFFSITEFADKPLTEDHDVCSVITVPVPQGEQLSKIMPPPPPLQPDNVT